jgi:hypothetical protein
MAENNFREIPSGRLREGVGIFFQQIPDGVSELIQNEFFEASAATNVYSCVGSGSLSLSGNSTNNLTLNKTGIGTLSLSGNATTSYSVPIGLIVGTNCGFVLVAPTSSPSANVVDADSFTQAGKFTAPAGSISLTEIGFYIDNTPSSGNYRVGIYANNSGAPGALLASAVATAVVHGWNRAAVSYSITPGTIYYLAVQLDNTDVMNTLYADSITEDNPFRSGQTSLADPFGTPSFTLYRTPGIYGLYEGEPVPITKIAAAGNYSSGTETTLDVGPFDIAAGDILVAWNAWEDGDVGTLTMADSVSAMNQFTMYDRNNYGGSYGCMGVLLSATAKNAAMIRVTYGTGRPYHHAGIFQFRPAAGKIVSVDFTPVYGSDNSIAVTTPTFSTTGSDDVVVAGYKSYDGRDVDDMNTYVGADKCDYATETLRPSDLFYLWHKIKSGTYSNVAATTQFHAPRGTASAWIAHAIAIKVVNLGIIGSGTLTLSGQASNSIIIAYSGSGTMTLSGNAVTNETLSDVGTGTLSLSGSATTKVTLSHVASGTLSLSGNSTNNLTLSQTGSGNLTLSGSATTSYSGAAIYSFTGSGTLSLSGNATYTSILSYSGSGNLSLSGNATYKSILNYSGSGALSLSGSATVKETLSKVGIGTLSLSGSATNNLTLSKTGNGTLNLSGSATTKLSFDCLGNGTLSLSGNATYKSIISYSGSGNLTLAGSATTSSSGGGTYVYVVDMYNGIRFACDIPPSSSDIRIKSGATIIGIPVITATDNHAGSVRIKANGVVKALKIV